MMCFQCPTSIQRLSNIRSLRGTKMESLHLPSPEMSMFRSAHSIDGFKSTVQSRRLNANIHQLSLTPYLSARKKQSTCLRSFVQLNVSVLFRFKHGYKNYPRFMNRIPDSVCTRSVKRRKCPEGLFIIIFSGGWTGLRTNKSRDN